MHEWFTHHEDVRRADGREPRHDADLDEAVWASLARWGPMLTKRLDVGVRLETPDGRGRDVHDAGDGHGRVVLTAPPGELMLRLFGRPVEVAVTGDDAAVAAFAGSSLGF